MVAKFWLPNLFPKQLCLCCLLSLHIHPLPCLGCWPPPAWHLACPCHLDGFLWGSGLWSAPPAPRVAGSTPPPYPDGRWWPRRLVLRPGWTGFVLKKGGKGSTAGDATQCHHGSEQNKWTFNQKGARMVSLKWLSAPRQKHTQLIKYSGEDKNWTELHDSMARIFPCPFMGHNFPSGHSKNQTGFKTNSWEPSCKVLCLSDHLLGHAIAAHDQTPGWQIDRHDCCGFTLGWDHDAVVWSGSQGHRAINPHSAKPMFNVGQSLTSYSQTGSNLLYGHSWNGNMGELRDL